MKANGWVPVNAEATGTRRLPRSDNLLPRVRVGRPVSHLFWHIVGSRQTPTPNSDKAYELLRPRSRHLPQRQGG